MPTPSPAKTPPPATAAGAAARADAPEALRLPTLRELVTLRCPICWQGAMFAHPLRMHPACPACGHVYDRGNGYFLGAMMFSYTIVVVILAAVVAVLRFAGVSWGTTILVGAALIPLVGPLLAFPYSRLWWVMIERRALRGGEAEDAALRAELEARRARATTATAAAAAAARDPADEASSPPTSALGSGTT